MKTVWRAGAALAALAACGLASGPAAAQKRGGTLRMYLPDSPPSGSILEESTISVVQPFMAVYDNLVQFDQHAPRNTMDDIQPDLATGWSWSADRRDLTLKLREGVTWHDGKPFTANDVKCTWDLLAGKGPQKMRKNPRRIWYENLRETTVDGPLQVTFHLDRPEPSFLAMLASGYSPVYPCHVSPAQMRTHPIGTGPFKFVEFKPNEDIRLARNPDYWKKGHPYLDGIVTSIIPSRSTRILAFETGDFDVTWAQDVSIPLLKDLKARAPKAVCDITPANVSTNLIVNRDRPPFDNADVRRAMQLSIDRKSFVDIISQGYAKIGGAMLPPPEGSWGMPKEMLQSVPGYSPDVEKSRAEGQAIMRRLGYGPDKPLKIKVATRNIAVYRDPAVLLIDQLKHVYIEAELDPIDTSVWYAKIARGDYSVGLNLTGAGVDDPDVNFYENYSCKSERNYTHYCNHDIEKMFDEQSAMADVEKRKRLVWDIDRRLQEDGARPIIFQNVNATCRQPDVKGLTFAVNSIYNNWRLDDVWLDR